MAADPQASLRVEGGWVCPCPAVLPPEMKENLLSLSFYLQYHCHNFVIHTQRDTGTQTHTHARTLAHTHTHTLAQTRAHFAPETRKLGICVSQGESSGVFGENAE